MGFWKKAFKAASQVPKYSGDASVTATGFALGDRGDMGQAARRLEKISASTGSIFGQESLGREAGKIGSAIPGTATWRSWREGVKNYFNPQAPDMTPQVDPATQQALAEEEAQRRLRRSGRGLLATSRAGNGLLS